MTRPQWIRRSWAWWLVRYQARRAPVRRAWTMLGEGASAEAHAGALLRRAIVREPMSDTQLAAVRAQLRRARAPVVRWVRASQVAVGLVVMLLAGILLAAARRFWIRPAPAIVSGASPAVVAPPRSRHVHTRAPDEVVAPPTEPRPLAQPAVGATAPPARWAPATPVSERSKLVAPAARGSSPHVSGLVGASAERPRSGARSATTRDSNSAALADAPRSSVASPSSVVAGSAPLDESQLAEESRLLARALREVRQDNDPAAALATLDEHAARFGQRGALIPEASTARVEVLLRLGRHSDALTLLDGMVLATGGRSRALLAARAELRAEQGRCSAASLDFDRLLERGGDNDAIVERALHGRAGCRALAGDGTGARADLEAYLAHFPDGRFAADARATLKR